jgi:hypothetical protein
MENIGFLIIPGHSSVPFIHDHGCHEQSLLTLRISGLLLRQSLPHNRLQSSLLLRPAKTEAQSAMHSLLRDNHLWIRIGSGSGKFDR